MIVFFSQLLLSSPCALSVLADFLAPKLGENGTKEECGVRYRRSSQHPFPPKFPCPPPQSCGLDQLNTKNNIPPDQHKHRTLPQKVYCRHPICIKIRKKIWWGSVSLNSLSRLCWRTNGIMQLKHICQNCNSARCVVFLKPHFCASAAHVLMLFIQLCSLATVFPEWGDSKAGNKGWLLPTFNCKCAGNLRPPNTVFNPKCNPQKEYQIA